jgi:peptide/nickel transport system permease protein
MSLVTNSEGAAHLDAPHEDDEGLAKARLPVSNLIAIGWLIALSLVALFADVLPFADPKDTRAGKPLSGPSWHNWLGTDQLGRDLFSRSVYGARVSIVVGIAAVLLSCVVGGCVGLFAGYSRRRADTVIMFLVDVLLAFPALLLAVSIVAFTNSRGPVTVVFAIALIYLGPTVRIVRGLTLNVGKNDFVLAARAIGSKNSRVIRREILPNVLPSILSLAIVAIAGAMVAEGGLAYLNLSVAPPTPTWGAMMASGVSKLDRSVYPAVVPAGAMFLTVLALTVIGDHLQQRGNREGGAI